MVNRLLLKIREVPDLKRLASSFSFLFVLNISNFIFPIITFPYLIRVLGMEKFGLLSFSTSLITYFIFVTEYGFNLSATRDISVNRLDSRKLSQIFSSVIILKVLLSVICFIVLAVLVLTIPKLRLDANIYFLTFLTLFGQLLFPVWLFQGLEKMKIASILYFVAKVIFTSAIFIFVKDKSDYFLVPILTSIGFFAITIASLYIVIIKMQIKFRFQKIKVLKFYLMDGFHLFVSNISMTLYTTSTIT
ncbi:MAG TPA: oligosaccharide flippase family protein, partial [Flavobacterium sp.]|nr:oligosaccharide flippase family protein [Flavobacterium sp.]